MVSNTMDALEWLRKQLDGDENDLLREMVRGFAQRHMAAEVDAFTGAGWGEVSPERVNYNNGYRQRPFDTRVGSIELADGRSTIGGMTVAGVLVWVTNPPWSGVVSTTRHQGPEHRPAGRKNRPGRRETSSCCRDSTATSTALASPPHHHAGRAGRGPR